VKAKIFKFLPLLFGFGIIIGLQGCETVQSYCVEEEARAVLRAVNPYELAGAAVTGGCAAVNQLSEEEEKMYSHLPDAMFLVGLPDEGIQESDVGKLVSEIEATEEKPAGAEVRIFGKTIRIQREFVAVDGDEADAG